MLSGETLVYNSSGKLTEIWDTLATPNKVLVGYDGAGQVSTVTDASAKRRLLFSYTSGALTSLQFQISIASVWTTQHTTSYAYTSGAMTGVTIGGQLAQTNVYTSGYLTRIEDGSAKTIVDITYTTATVGKVARIDTPRGTIGFEWASTRSTCSGQTVLHFNRGTTGTCNVDGDCGTGYLCGGKTGTGSTGTCFRAARCLTVSSPSEDVITTVAPIGPPSESCTGACTDVAQYVRNTGTGVLNVAATQDPAGFFSSRVLNAHGLPTTVSYGDSDSNASSGTQHRTEWRFYDNTSFPGKVTEVRRKSDLHANASSCAGLLSSTTGCARTLFVYDGNGKLQTITESGSYWLPSGGVGGYSNVTTFSFDAKGRLTQIDGPLAGTNDVTQLTYHSPTGALKDDFVHEYKRKKDSTTFLTQSAVDYDFWGNPTALVDADSTRTCLSFSSARGHLVSHTEKMTAHSDCTTHVSNIVTTWARDSALRLTQITRPDGSCIFYEYDSKARLQKIKRRDDCVAANAGDTVELVYDTEGLVTETQIKNAAGTITAKQPFTYHDSRRLERIVNPADTSKWTGLTYDTRGLLQQVDGPSSLGKTVFNRTSTPGSPGAEGRVTSIDKYKTSTAFDSWNLLYDWLGNQDQVTDGDSFATVTKRDDLGRTFRFTSPDLTHPREHFFDAASRLTSVNEAVGGGTASRWHYFTFDNIGRPLVDDYASACTGTSPPPEITRVYDAPPVTCPISGGCNRTGGRLAYVKTTLLCATGLADGSLDQETFYSYDDAGRMITEYMRDDSGRIAIQHFGWTANGDLQQVTTPSGAVIGSTFGSTGSNSDTDRIAAVWRTSTSTPVVDQVHWEPFGPLRQYNQQSTLSGVATRTRITRNLAYRVTKIDVATQTGSATLHAVDITEDAKGRVTARDYTPNITGVSDSYFRYDDQDRVLCETTTSVASCPTSGTNIKNSHSASPPFRNAGEWKELKRPIPGSTGLNHIFNSGITPTNHQIKNVDQNDSGIGVLAMSYDAYGNRTFEDGRVASDRSFTYDKRHNLVGVTARPASSNVVTTSAFDAQTRRVYKQATTVSTSSTDKYWFYYDPMGRLIELTYTIGADPTVYVIQFFWLGDRLAAMWETWSGWSTGTSKRYVHTDESGRPIELWTWPASGDTTRLWAINQSAWGFDTNVVGPSVFQPFLFAGQFQDRETAASIAGTQIHRPGLALDHRRSQTYDAFTGADVQHDGTGYLAMVDPGKGDSDEDETPTSPEGEGPYTGPGKSIDDCGGYCPGGPGDPNGGWGPWTPPGGGGGPGWDWPGSGGGGSGGGGIPPGGGGGMPSYPLAVTGIADVNELEDPNEPVNPWCDNGPGYSREGCYNCRKRCEDEAGAIWDKWCDFIEDCQTPRDRDYRKCVLERCENWGQPCGVSCTGRSAPLDMATSIPGYGVNAR